MASPSISAGSDLSHQPNSFTADSTRLPIMSPVNTVNVILIRFLDIVSDLRGGMWVGDFALLRFSALPFALLLAGVFGYRAANKEALPDTDTEEIRTGPSRPEGNKAESAVYGWITVNVYLFPPDFWSPIIRFTHALITFMVMSLLPGFSASVTSTRYGACHTAPSDLPFTVTTARFFTSPKSIHNPRTPSEPSLQKPKSSSYTFRYRRNT